MIYEKPTLEIIRLLEEDIATVSEQTQIDIWEHNLPLAGS